MLIFYNQNWMELLLNLLWLCLGCSLLCLWGHTRSRAAHSAATRRRRDLVQMPHPATQCIALALLIILLFPVISLTDDLAVCAVTTAETEHALRSQKLDDIDRHAPSPTWAALFTQAWNQQGLPLLPYAGGRDTWTESTHPSTGVRLSITDRPPPVLA